jgi:hypothetical protein
MHLLKSCELASLTLAFGCKRISSFLLAKADVAELADALDSKSSTGNSVWVRSPPSAECGSDRRCPSFGGKRVPACLAGRVALPRDRRCTSGNFPFADYARSPFCPTFTPFCVFTLYEDATPVARERNPTAHVCPYDTFLGNAGLFA